MPQFNLTTMNGAELRKLLDSARARGEARLSYQILQEMASRREGGAVARLRRFGGRRSAEPRVIEMDLGDPLESGDEIPPAPSWRPPEPQVAAAQKPATKPKPKPTPAPKPVPEPEAETALVIELTPAMNRRKRRASPRPKPAPATVRSPEPVAEPLPPLELKPRSVWDDDPPPPKPEPAPKAKPERPPLRVGRLAATFVVGAASGVMAGWGLSQLSRPAPTPPAKPVQVAAVAPPRAPAAPPVLPVVAEPAPIPDQAPPEPAIETAATETTDVATTAETGDVRDVTGVALELPAPAAVKKTEAAPPVRDLCAAEPTPADRAICGDPRLQRLQRELRQAYAEALDAHEERGLLRERQLAWRSARDEVSDPQQLARLYEQRIRKLNAATAEARRLR